MPTLSQHLHGPWKAILGAEDGEHIWTSPADVPEGAEVAISVVRGAALVVALTGTVPGDFEVDEMDVLYLINPDDVAGWEEQFPARWEQAQAVAAALNALPGRPEAEVTQEPEPAEFCDAPDGVIIALTGELDHVLRHITKQGNAYVTAILRLPDGSVLVEVPPATYGQFGGLIAEGEIRDLTGSVDRRGEEPKLVVHAVATP